MMILARSGQTYARLAFSAGLKADLEMPVRVDWSACLDVLAKSSRHLMPVWANGGRSLRPKFSLCRFRRLLL
jgi:hypothetical protein